MDSNAHRIGAALRTAREDLGLTREHLAANMRERGYSTVTNTVMRWEATGSIRVAELLDLAIALEVSPCDILAAAYATEATA